MTENKEVEKPGDFLPLKHFYKDKTVFITGGLGFIGRVIVEKLLRTGQVKEVICIVRDKKGKTLKERAQKFFSGVLFSVLREIDPNYETRIKLVEGDIEKPRLGLSIPDEKYVRENASIFIHTAATIKFNEPLAKAAAINVRGTIEILNMAKRVKTLDSFVHVSTAYAHCPRKNIDEEFYPPPMTAEELIQFLESIDKFSSKDTDSAIKSLISPWPNTYVYTKAIAESVVEEYGQEIPVAVVRPSMVCFAHEDPIPGWTGTIQQLNGLVIGNLIGLIRFPPRSKDYLQADAVPVDFVSNTILSAAWKTARDWHKNDYKPSIYHVISGSERPLTYRQGHSICADFRLVYPINQTIWAPAAGQTSNPIVFFFLKMFSHYLFGLFFDTFLVLTGKKPQLLSTYRKVHEGFHLMEYFCLRQWNFTNKNARSLLNSLTDEEKNLFPFDFFRIDYVEYFRRVVRSVKVNFFKEPLDTIPQARRKLRILIAIHNTILTITYALLSYFAVSFLIIFYKRYA